MRPISIIVFINTALKQTGLAISEFLGITEDLLGYPGLELKFLGEEALESHEPCFI